MSTATQSGGKKEFKLIPGKKMYNLKVDKLEIKMSERNPNCIMAKTELSVTDGDYKGYKVWDSFILNHQNETPRKIGREIVDSLLKATGHSEGVAGLNEDFASLPDMVTGKEVVGKIYVEESKNPQYGDRNRVYRFGKNY